MNYKFLLSWGAETYPATEEQTEVLNQYKWEVMKKGDCLFLNDLCVKFINYNSKNNEVLLEELDIQ